MQLNSVLSMAVNEKGEGGRERRERCGTFMYLIHTHTKTISNPHYMATLQHSTESNNRRGTQNFSFYRQTRVNSFFHSGGKENTGGTQNFLLIFFHLQTRVNSFLYHEVQGKFPSKGCNSFIVKCKKVNHKKVIFIARRA